MIPRTTRKAIIKYTRTRIILFKSTREVLKQWGLGGEMSGRGEWWGSKLIYSYFVPRGISGSECKKGTQNAGFAQMEHCCFGKENPAELVGVAWDWLNWRDKIGYLRGLKYTGTFPLNTVAEFWSCMDWEVQSLWKAEGIFSSLGAEEIKVRVQGLFWEVGRGWEHTRLSVQSLGGLSPRNRGKPGVVWVCTSPSLVLVINPIPTPTLSA